METYIVADNIISPLGFSSQENFESIQDGKTGIRLNNPGAHFPRPYYASKFSKDQWDSILQEKYTSLEGLYISSIQQVIDQLQEFDKSRTILVLATTKGNIDLLSETNPDYAKIEIPTLTQKIADYFQIPYAVTISNACISGLSALLTAQNVINSGDYDHAIVTGGDLVSDFIVSGFDSFKAMSANPCKPYDKNRDGINLGEGCGTVFLSNSVDFAKVHDASYKLVSGAQTNDANHISGPSRTGKGLVQAVQNSLDKANLNSQDIDVINAHGTATLFNDEMESIAFNTLGLSNKPLNSLKGYLGHTLGASGIIESILSAYQLKNQKLIATRGYDEVGTSKELAVIQENGATVNANTLLKTISGFGGTNAAIILQLV